ncbi:MAG: sel1 repeat family protein [Victivallales bacterium]|nr:sel1 repeat family protein [Victivallales bacterium]
MHTCPFIVIAFFLFFALTPVHGQNITPGTIGKPTMQPARPTSHSPFNSNPWTHRQKTRTEKMQDRQDAYRALIKREDNEKNPAKLCAIGLKYQLGLNGTEKDMARAMEMYLKAAEQNYAEAQCRIGLIYEAGQGGIDNPELAAKWFKKAAKQNHEVALLHLGVFYMEGKGVKKDLEKAVKYLRKASKKYPDAGYVLGTIYEFGRDDIQPDAAEAEKWYKVALNSKHPENIKKADDALNRLEAPKAPTP